MKKIIVLSVLTSTAFFLSGCGRPIDPVETGNSARDEQDSSVNPPVSVQPTSTASKVDDSSGWQTYKNDKFKLEFQIPKEYSVNSLGSEWNDELEFKRGNEYVFGSKITNWKKYVIGEDSSNIYPRIARDKWQYFVNNFDQIKTGNCNNEEKKYSTTLGDAEICKITKKDNFIIVEIDQKDYAHELFFYSKDVDAAFSFGRKVNSEVVEKIISSFTFEKADDRSVN